jgi:hypothetical protein
MPIDLVTIQRVDSVQTAKAGTMNYTITATTIEDRPRTVQYQTVNDWRASVCHQAIAPKRELWINWRSSNFKSKDIVGV